MSPIGRQVGNYWQVYASNSNENTYTAEWTGRFFGFKYLPRTLEATEFPRRLKPVNIYYHMYSGQKLASLNGLIDNLEYARRSESIPITASHFASIGRGFFTGRLTEVGKRRWRVDNRGRLQTIRFDDTGEGTGETLDFERSRGVLGMRRVRTSLYVALDPSAQSPIIALREPLADAPRAPPPYLGHSRWPVRRLTRSGEGFEFSTQGYGDGELVWQVSRPATFEMRVSSSDRTEPPVVVASDESGRLTLVVPGPRWHPLRISIRPAAGANR